MGVDILFLIPFDGDFETMVDPTIRQNMAPRHALPVKRAMMAFEEYIGCELTGDRLEDRPVFGGKPVPMVGFRSATSVTMATHLEKAGLTWEMVDPGVRDLAYWRERIAKAGQNPPKVVGISTTFIGSELWLRSLCAMVRRSMPNTKLMIGGYYYATNAKHFLSLDADVCCVGEGEVRLPQMVKAVIDGRGWDDIPGLYIRRADGRLHPTPRAEPIALARIPRPDWTLAERIEPKLDLGREIFEMSVETQRGCVFKCEFCTFRTLASLSIMPPEDAVDALFNTKSVPNGIITLQDATATFPHERWKEIMKAVIERGGLPHPMWCFARVSDLHDENVQLMAKAGVRAVFIGQESADQRLLNAMKKGTRVEDIMPAVEAMSRHGLVAEMAFIHGFPGEDEKSLMATRELLGRVNAANPDKPVVIGAHFTPFMVQDLASVSTRDTLKNIHSVYGYEALAFPYSKAIDAMFESQLYLSKIPHAPVVGFAFRGLPHLTFTSMVINLNVHEIFRYAKAVDRGVGMFLERDLAGTPVNEVELARIRTLVRNHLPTAKQIETRRARYAYRFRQGLQLRILGEWDREQKSGVGALTRLMLGQLSHQATGSLVASVRGMTRGAFQADVKEPKVQSANLDDLAKGLIAQSIENGRIAKVSKALDVAMGSPSQAKTEPPKAP